MNEKEASRSALLVVDVQQGNTAEGWDREAVIGRIAGLIQRARADGVPVVWIQHEAEPLLPGTPAWEIVPAVRPGADDPVIAKQYFDAFADTTLREELDRRGVTRVVVCGASTDACIRMTTLRALVEGYDTTLVSDAHTTDVGPWPLPLPDGSTVPVGAREMVAYTNFFVADTSYPGVTTQVVPAAEVQW